MANEILTATDAFEFATTLLGRPRNEADGLNQLKEQSGISLGSGYVLTDSRFLTANNRGPTDPADLTVQRGAGITGAEGPSLTADSIIELSSSNGDLTEIALIETSDATGPLIGMVVYADPDEASGDFTMTGYGRGDDGASARAYDFSLTTGSYETTTLKNRTSTDDVWLVAYDPMETYELTGGAGFYQELDIDGDGTATWYAAGLLVGPYVPSDASDNRFAVDPIGDVYFDIAAQLLAAGVDADDIGRNALIASSSGGLLEGTFLNEDFMGSGAADTLVGNNGEDFMIGGAGDDSLDAGAQMDTLLGGLGEDTLRGRGGRDELFGDEGNDRLLGNGGADTIEGGVGNDTLNGGGGADSLLGGDDNDRLNGGNGGDVMNGGDGDDILRGQNGADTLTGGAGDDRFQFRDDVNDTVTDFVIGEDRVDMRFTTATQLSDLTLTDIAAGEVDVTFNGQTMTLLDGDGVADFTAADFTAGDFIF